MAFRPACRLPIICAALALAGCSPALDWRELRPPSGGIVALFPCKPSGQERRIALGGRAVRLELHACSAGGRTWGLVTADLEDPTLLGQALDELASAAAGNIAAGPGQRLPLGVAGATPHASNQRLQLQGRKPDGQAVQMQLAVFAHGTWVFQATVLGDTLPAEDADTFFSALRFVP